MKLLLLLLFFTLNTFAGFTPFPPNPVGGTLTAKGEMLSHDGSADTILSIGTAGQILTIDLAEPTGIKWADAPVVSPTTTLGDLIVRGASADERLAIGADDQVLTVEAGALVYKDPAASDNTNALINPQFDKAGNSWTITGGCVASYPETVELGFTLRLTCTAATFSVKQVITTLTPFTGQQAAFDVQVKSDATGVKVSSISNSVRNTEYSVNNLNEFNRFKQIGVVVDSTNNGLEIYSDVAFTGVIDIDNTYLGLANLTQEVTKISQWESFEMDIQGSVSNPTKASTIAFEKAVWRRVGDSMQIRYDYQHDSSVGATAGSGYYKFMLPSGYTIDASKVGGVALYSTFGSGSGYAISRGNLSGYAAYRGLDFITLQLTSNTQTPTEVGSSFAPLTDSGVRYSFIATVPIEGWTASSVAAVQEQGLEVIVRASGNTGNIVTATTERINFNTIEEGAEYWTQNGGNGANEFEAPETGNYLVTGSVSQLTTNGIDLYKNNVLHKTLMDYEGSYTASELPFSNAVYLEKGDKMSLRFRVTATLQNIASAHNIHIQKLISKGTILGAFKQIKSDDLVHARYTSNNGQSIPNGAETIINFEDVEEDVQGTVTTGGSWKFTAPKAGSYTIAPKIEYTIVNGRMVQDDTATLRLFKNGVQFSEFDSFEAKATPANVQSLTLKGSMTVKLAQGDYIDVRAQHTFTTAAALTTNSTKSHISITETATKEYIVENLAKEQATIAARYTSNNGATVLDSGTVIFEDLDHETDDSYNTTTGEYTIAVAGRYSFSAQVRTGSTENIIGLRVNGALKMNSYTHYNSSGTTSLSGVFNLSVGDVIKITNEVGLSRTLNTNGVYNSLSIHRIK